jgi:hypothetical protein
MHSAHLPFQCSKVYRLHINYNMTKKETRIILLILNFKLGTVNNRKDYLQTWGYIFLLKHNRYNGLSRMDNIYE